MRTRYFSDDGKEHSSAAECKKYEAYQKSEIEKRLHADLKLRNGSARGLNNVPYGEFTALYIKTFEDFKFVSQYLSKQKPLCHSISETEFDGEDWYLFVAHEALYSFGSFTVYRLGKIKGAYEAFLKNFEK